LLFLVTDRQQPIWPKYWPPNEISISSYPPQTRCCRSRHTVQAYDPDIRSRHTSLYISPTTVRPLARLPFSDHEAPAAPLLLSLIHISEPTRRTPISYAVFCLK